jgi:predicted ester cyclase
MSVEDTQRTMDAYGEDLLGRGSYKRHFADDVRVTIVGTDQEARGPDAAERMIDHLHREAFDAYPEITNAIFAESKALFEALFVGKHVGEFAGIEATGREVRVPYCVVYDLEEEKLKALRLYFPMDVLMRQLGVAPALGQPAEEETSPM